MVEFGHYTIDKSTAGFHSENRSVGKKIYVVDSVALTEGELILLYNKGTLTRDGIRDLVGRAA
jgi:hypothetical protein